MDVFSRTIVGIDVTKLGEERLEQLRERVDQLDLEDKYANIIFDWATVDIEDTTEKRYIVGFYALGTDKYGSASLRVIFNEAEKFRSYMKKFGIDDMFNQSDIEIHNVLHFG